MFTRPGNADCARASVNLLVQDVGPAKVVNIVPQAADPEEHTDNLTTAQYNQILDEFAAFATPLAHAHGLHVEHTADTADATRWLSTDAAEALRSFSALANKSTGSSHPRDWERWARFIVLAHRENSDLDGSTLRRLLVEDHGWPEDRADELGSEYDIGRGVLEVNDNMAS